MLINHEKDLCLLQKIHFLEHPVEKSKKSKFLKNRKKCLAVDPCIVNKGGCQHHCVSV